jgi:hypothetical protein
MSGPNHLDEQHPIAGQRLLGDDPLPIPDESPSPDILRPRGARRSGSARRPRRWRRTLLRLLMVGVVVIALFAAGLLVLVDRDPTGKAALSGVLPDRKPVARTANGVFAGAELSRVKAYQKWFGGDLDRVVMFADRSNWGEIANPRDMLAEWKGSGFRLVYSVALLPEQDSSATIAQGAAGAYDQYYTQLAGNLVKGGQAHAILRLGWEFNLEGSRWSTGDSKAFIGYWRHVVTAMRAVPGQHFQFDWNPNNGKTKYDAVKYYPGNDVVDYIGIDAYDVSYAWGGYPYPKNCDSGCRADHQKVAWNKSIYGGKRGLKFWSAFAGHRGKPMSLPEWGLWDRIDHHGGGDDPAYLRRMHDFITTPENDVAYQSYFEFDGPDGPHRLMTTFADSGNTFRALFAQP